MKPRLVLLLAVVLSIGAESQPVDDGFRARIIFQLAANNFESMAGNSAYYASVWSGMPNGAEGWVCWYFKGRESAFKEAAAHVRYLSATNFPEPAATDH